MAGAKVEQFLDAVAAYDHRRGMPLFDEAVRDLETGRTALLGILLTAADQRLESPGTPHALLTAEAGRQLLSLAGWPASLPVLRFLALYAFTLPRRGWTPGGLQRMAAKIRVAPGTNVRDAFARALAGRRAEESAALAVYLAREEGIEAAGDALVAVTLGDVGRLHHNLALAVAAADAAVSLGFPAGTVALAGAAYDLARLMEEYAPPAIERLQGGPGEPRELEAALAEDDFDAVHRQLQGLAAGPKPEAAMPPLLVAACLEPGFLGHALQAAHAARLALPHLEPPERAFLLWKLYRTLVSRFGYPEGLELRGDSPVAPEAAIEALKSSLKVKSPPVERTLREALGSGVPLAKVLQHVVYNWTHWTVGEKEHTLQYLNAAVQTAAFLGKEGAMVPLVTVLYKLPF
jgi:hypothetical protein